MLGRSDGVLNPGGVRFGSAELYDVLERAFSPPAGPVADCIAVGQTLPGGTDERVVLGVRLVAGVDLTPELEQSIKKEIRARRTARHVPAVVSRYCPSYFHSCEAEPGVGARADRADPGRAVHAEWEASRGASQEGICVFLLLLCPKLTLPILGGPVQILNGAPASSVNAATLRNPECLAEYEALGTKLRAEVAAA
jgi:acetoacetyl-CoA synthetase